MGETAITLYGFLSTSERDWFRALVTVQGVGARVALALLSALEPAEISDAAVLQDHKVFARANGVGPKLAKRLATELKDKATSLSLAAAGSGAADTRSVQAPSVVAGGAGEALSALVNLGYGQDEADKAVRAARSRLGPDVEAPTLIREALKEFAA